MRGIVNQVIERLLAGGRRISSTEVARAAGISRQAAHKQLRALVEAGALAAEGKARACRYRRAAPAPAPLRTRLEVATAGSLYRLSARLLLDGLGAGEAVLDFTGVADVGEEFLEEIFVVWAPAHPRVSLRVEHLPSRCAPMLFALARRQRPSPERAPRDGARSAC